jgi:hypothetical protein
MTTNRQFRKLLFGIFTAGLFSCCATLKPAKTDNKIPLNSENLSQVTGRFERGEWDIKGADLFWNFFLESRGGDKMDLCVIDDRYIRVTFLNNGDTVKSRILRGRIKDGHFEFRRRVKVYPLILGNVFKNGKVRIALTTSGDLIVDSRDLLYGHILIFPVADGHKKYDRVHKRIQ